MPARRQLFRPVCLCCCAMHIARHAGPALPQGASQRRPAPGPAQRRTALTVDPDGQVKLGCKTSNAVICGSVETVLTTAQHTKCPICYPTINPPPLSPTLQPPPPVSGVCFAAKRPACYSLCYNKGTLRVANGHSLAMHGKAVRGCAKICSGRGAPVPSTGVYKADA